MLTSPLSRARDTCALAGFATEAVLDDRLMEWDYGQAEGRTTEDMRRRQPDWSVWTHPIEGGESLDQVAGRADRIVAELCSPHQVSLVFAHAHLLRILGARSCGLAAAAGRHLVLDPGGVGVLGYERDTPCLLRWNIGEEAIPSFDRA